VTAVLDLADVSLRIDGHSVLRGIDWVVRPGERWVVLGPNGAGKTSLLRIASLQCHPSAGRVEVLGHRLGEVDVRRLRIRVGLVSAAVIDALRTTTTAIEAVASALYGALVPWWSTVTDADWDRARRQLDRFGVRGVADQTFGSLSSGERQRVLLARALVTDPDLVLLDEPAAGLDLGAREDLVTLLGRLATDPAAPPSVLVTHHVEEIPPGTTHALLLRDGGTSAQGELGAVLTDAGLSACFGMDLALSTRDGRWAAHRRPED
jgi:iron complex transport system ATP-binding protein